MHLRTRMYAAGLIAWIMLPFGGSFVPDDPLLSRTNVFSIEARARQATAARARICRWNNVDWQDMSEEQRKAWQTLGWTQQMWDSDDPAAPPASDSKAWTDLSEDERAAAGLLGYKPNSWDADNCR